MKSAAEFCRLKPGEEVDLAKLATRMPARYHSKADYNAMLAEHVGKLSKMQERLFAEQGQALLIIFQGLDAAGKDGAISHLLTGVNPEGVTVHAFKQPSKLEYAHDFLWRAAIVAPERGLIGVFNRSYYEAVAITRVHPKLLHGEGYGRKPRDLDAFFEERLVSIKHYERHLQSCGTKIVKIFLHISPEEQRKRLLERLDDPEKVWKASLSDVMERKHFKEYWRAFETAFAATSTKDAPWHVVPADDKYDARLLCSQIVVEAMESLDLETQPVDKERRRELAEIREALKG
jgi:PPK2 family polyphosphate:nucleotide phosphotransferase